MRVYLFDQYEFESSSTEEMLHVVIAHKSECPSVQNFLEKSHPERFRWVQHDAERDNKSKRWRKMTKGMPPYSPVDHYDPVPLLEHPRARELRDLTTRFACFPEPLENFTVIAEMYTPPITPFRMELLLESQRRFIWYKWDSTA